MTQEKVKKKKRRRKKNYLLRLIVIMAIVVGLYYFASSSIFDIDEIIVKNNSFYTSEQIAERAGVTQGQNIFLDVNKKEMKSALLLDPYIKNVQIKRILPNQIVFDVNERTEAAGIPYANEYILIDADGLVLRMSQVEPKLPLLIGLTVKSLETGKALEVEENALLNGTLNMIKAVNESEIYFKKVDISKIMVKAYVYDHLICQGMPEDITARIEDKSLEKMIYELYTQGIERGVITVTADPTNMAFSPAYE